MVCRFSHDHLNFKGFKMTNTAIASIAATAGATILCFPVRATKAAGTSFFALGAKLTAEGEKATRSAPSSSPSAKCRRAGTSPTPA